MNVLWLDTETRCVLDLRKVGAARYFEAAEVLTVQWALNDEAPGVWQCLFEPCPQQLLDDLAAADVVRAHNAGFDRGAIAKLDLGVDAPERWDCMHARSARAGWPTGSLDGICKFAGLTEEFQKFEDGKRLLDLFCKPTKWRGRDDVDPFHDPRDYPDDWQLFLHYGLQDIVSMRAAWDRIPDFSTDWARQFERNIWVIDQHINDNGLPVDMTTVLRAVQLVHHFKRVINAELTELTGGRVTSPTQVQRINALLEDEGCPLGNLGADAVTHALAFDPSLSPMARRVLELRRDGARATNGKWDALMHATSTDYRIRGTLMYGGASRTLRWSGRKFQPQNLIRPERPWDSRELAEVITAGAAPGWFEQWGRPPLELLAFAIRGAIKAPEGFKILRGDLSQIEARVVNWLAGGWRMLEAFADPERDPYTETAHDVGSQDRQLGKVLVLACGYGMGFETFRDTALGYGIQLTSHEAEVLVRAWREANPDIRSFWYQLDDAVCSTLLDGQPRNVRRLQVDIADHFGIRYLRIWLPSGRPLLYPRARVKYVTRFGETKPQMEFVSRYNWERTYGGKLVENVTQALARDVLAHGMALAYDAGFDLIGHVHDELLALARDGSNHTHEYLGELLTTRPWWADEHLPLAADTGETVRYAKL